MRDLLLHQLVVHRQQMEQNPARTVLVRGVVVEDLRMEQNGEEPGDHIVSLIDERASSA